MKRTRWITYVVLAVAVLLSIAPLYWMYVVGSNDSSAISRFPPAFLPGGNFGANLSVIEEKVPFGRSLINSAVVALSVALLQMFFCSLASFAFAKLRFPGRRALFVFVVATMAIPGQLGLVPMYMIMSQLGWIDSLQALIVPGAVSAFGVFWMRQVIVGSIPDELIEAAKVDGCSIMRTFSSVVLPNIRGAASVFGLFAAMAAWNDFLWPLVILSSPENFTSQVAIQQLRNAVHDRLLVGHDRFGAGDLAATRAVHRRRQATGRRHHGRCGEGMNADDLRVGVLGVGRIGRFHTRTLLEHPSVGQVTVWDPQRDAIAALGPRVHIADSPAELLNDNLDAVLICSSSSTHADLLREAIAHAMPAFCEKPIATGLDETRRIAELVDKTGAGVTVGFQRRSDPSYRILKEQIDRDELGNSTWRGWSRPTRRRRPPATSPPRAACSSTRACTTSTSCGTSRGRRSSRCTPPGRHSPARTGSRPPVTPTPR